MLHQHNNKTPQEEFLQHRQMHLQQYLGDVCSMATSNTPATSLILDGADLEDSNTSNSNLARSEHGGERSHTTADVMLDDHQHQQQQKPSSSSLAMMCPLDIHHGVVLPTTPKLYASPSPPPPPPPPAAIAEGAGEGEGGAPSVCPSLPTYVSINDTSRFDNNSFVQTMLMKESIRGIHQSASALFNEPSSPLPNEQADPSTNIQQQQGRSKQAHHIPVYEGDAPEERRFMVFHSTRKYHDSIRQVIADFETELSEMLSCAYSVETKWRSSNGGDVGRCVLVRHHRADAGWLKGLIGMCIKKKGFVVEDILPSSAP